MEHVIWEQETNNIFFEYHVDLDNNQEIAPFGTHTTRKEKKKIKLKRKNLEFFFD